MSMQLAPDSSQCRLKVCSIPTLAGAKAKRWARKRPIRYGCGRSGPGSPRFSRRPSSI